MEMRRNKCIILIVLGLILAGSNQFTGIIVGIIGLMLFVFGLLRLDDEFDFLDVLMKGISAAPDTKNPFTSQPFGGMNMSTPFGNTSNGMGMHQPFSSNSEGRTLLYDSNYVESRDLKLERSTSVLRHSPNKVLGEALGLDENCFYEITSTIPSILEDDKVMKVGFEDDSYCLMNVAINSDRIRPLVKGVGFDFDITDVNYQKFIWDFSRIIKEKSTGKYYVYNEKEHFIENFSYLVYVVFE